MTNKANLSPAARPEEPAQIDHIRHLALLPRTINLLSGVLYAFFFRNVYENYVSVEWGFTGLIYKELPVSDLAFIYASIALVSWFLPRKLSRPSTIILWFLYAIVYVPTLCITQMIGTLPDQVYLLSLLAFSFGMILICRLIPERIVGSFDHLASFEPEFIQILLVVFFVSSLVILIAFWDIMQFSSIDDIYVQRFVAADIGSGPIGYLRTYYSSLIAPLLMAVGICDRSRRILVLLGTTGFIISYMIDASKVSLIIPLAMIAAGVLFRWKALRLYHLTAGLTALCMISALLTSSTRIVRFFADLVLLRSVSIPAQTFAQYTDVFYSKGYTWWSNITGLNLIVPVPAAFRFDRFWPVLGQMVGADYYGFNSRVNLNANPFVGEGVAAGGWIGVIVISIVFALFLRAIDSVSTGWNRRFLLVAMVPIGLTLTNVHLSTFLLSFGGAAWIGLFRFYKPTSRQMRVSLRP